jgi:uroporphyrin-3 C-methyltransferase
MADEEQQTTESLKPISIESPLENTGCKDQSSCFSMARLSSGLTLLFSLAALTMVFFNTQSNNVLQKKLLTQNKHLVLELKQLRQEQDNLKEQNTSNTTQMQQSQNNVQKKIEALNKQLETAMSQQLYQNQDWLLLKARYYIELAQINTHWSDNYNATITLLQQADKLLAQLNAPKVFEIRQALAKEMAQLKASPTLDIAGLLSELDAAQISVSALTIQLPMDTNQSVTEIKNTSPANLSSWHARFQESINLLEKLVVIRRHDEEIKPLLSPLFESILRESIRLNLQEAQWAILNNNPQVYQLALKQAIINLTRTFNKKNQDVTALLHQLNELQQTKLTQEKPPVGLALPLINQLIDSNNLAHTNEQGGN